MDPTTSREAKLRTATGILAALTAVGILLIALAPLAIPILALTALFLARCFRSSPCPCCYSST